MCFFLSKASSLSFFILSMFILLIAHFMILMYSLLLIIFFIVITHFILIFWSSTIQNIALINDAD